MYYKCAYLLGLMVLIAGCDKEVSIPVEGSWVLDRDKTLSWIENDSGYSESQKNSFLEFYNLESSSSRLMRMHFKGSFIEVHLPGVAIPMKKKIRKMDGGVYKVEGSEIILLDESSIRIDSQIDDDLYQSEFWVPYNK